MTGNNPPEVLVSLTRAQADFLIKNCESNMVVGLGALKGMSSRDLMEKMVAMIEDFKAIKIATEKALKE